MSMIATLKAMTPPMKRRQRVTITFARAGADWASVPESAYHGATSLHHLFGQCFLMAIFTATSASPKCSALPRVPFHYARRP